MYDTYKELYTYISQDGCTVLGDISADTVCSAAFSSDTRQTFGEFLPRDSHTAPEHTIMRIEVDKLGSYVRNGGTDGHGDGLHDECRDVT